MCNLLNTTPRESFMNTIIAYSDSDTYDEAIKEWAEFTSGPLDDNGYYKCICNQPIVKGSYIYNRVTRTFIVIGFNCRNKYIRNIENVSCRFVTWLYEKRFINEWENNFLRSISNKTGNYSTKQKAVYTRINNRIVDILINEYSLTPKHFKRS
jgi:hypothetical protein